MSQCLTCSRSLESGWFCCPHCGRRTESLDPAFGSRGSYGSGIRAQVFDVIVRQALAGAPWREICAGPMGVNGISPKEIELEVARRRDQNGGDNRQASGVPKKPMPDSGETGNSIALP